MVANDTGRITIRQGHCITESGTIPTMPIDPHQRLREIRIARGFATGTDAAKRFGWVISTYKSHENGIRPLSRQAAIRYARAFRVTVGWLLLGESENLYKLALNDKSSLASRVLPLLTWGAVKNMENISGAIEEAQEFYPVSPHDEIGPQAFVLTIEDESMANIDGRAGFPSFMPGDRIALDPEKPIIPGSFVLARVFTRGVAVFRQYREAGYDDSGRKLAMLQPLNAAWAPDQIVEAFLVRLSPGLCV